MNSAPVQQEKAAGNALLDLGHDVYAEVSTYKGRVYASLRRWFQADDGKWYRTKNGLHIKADEMIDILAQFEPLVKFLQTRAMKAEDTIQGEATPID
jgi:hypothetical protein